MAIVADLLGYIREIPVPESFVSSTKIFFVTPCISDCYNLTSDVSFGLWKPVMPVLVKKIKNLSKLKGPKRMDLKYNFLLNLA